MEDFLRTLENKYGNKVLNNLVESLLGLPEISVRLEKLENSFLDMSNQQKARRRWWDNQILTTGFTILGIVVGAVVLNKMGLK